MLNHTQQKRLQAARGLVPLPEAERAQYNVADVRPGGYIAFRDDIWLVEGIGGYLDVKWKDFARRKAEQEWTLELKLLSLGSGVTSWLEYSVDDGLEIFVVDREVRMREINLSRDELAHIIEEEDGSVVINHRRYNYSEEETWAALYYPDYYNRKGKRGQKVRMIEFESDNSNRGLTLEQWQEDDEDRPSREGFLYSSVVVDDIGVIALGSQEA